MAGVEEDLRARMVIPPFEESFEGCAVVQVLAGMQLEAGIYAGLLKRIEDRLPAPREFSEGFFDQTLRPLRPGIEIRPRERTGKCRMRAQTEVPAGLCCEQHLILCPFLPFFWAIAELVWSKRRE